MNINFFEEFPTKKNLEKVKKIKFPSLLFIASRDLKEFHKHENYVKKLNKMINVGYWPVLSKEEGYWMSPFSDKKGLEKLITDLDNEKKKLTILWDCEFPINIKRFLHPKNFFTNKKMIITFLQNTRHKLYIAQYVASIFLRKFFEFSGIYFPFIDKKIYMAYTSLVVEPFKTIYRNIIKKHSIVGLGTIARGIHGNEPELSPYELGSELKLAKENGVKEVFIFRLGGLNKKYMKIIEKYIN